MHTTHSNTQYKNESKVMAAYRRMTYGHLWADCLYTGINSGPNAQYQVWEAFTFLLSVQTGEKWS